MTGIRVTDEALNAAIDVMYPHVSHSDPIGTRGHVTRILAAAAAHLVDDRVTAALELHRPTRRRSNGDPACGECLGIASTVVPWPCPTARALGVES